MPETTHDLVIRGGTVVDSMGSDLVDVAIKSGKISALLSPGTELHADVEIDSTNHYVMPGGIDTHTHASWPFAGSRTDDGFDGAGRAAAVGGTTTMVDFVPPLEPEQRLITAARERIQEVERFSPIDVALHPILNRSDSTVIEDIESVIEAGLTSFKMFTTYAENRVDDGEVWLLMQEIVRHGGLPGFHAENHDLIERSTAQLVAQGKTSIKDFPASRPGLAEATTIDTLALMARKLGTPIYIFHVSGAEALQAVQRGNVSGGRVYAESCTHYLSLSDSVFTGEDPWKYVISPPIRSLQDQDALWDGLKSGDVVSVGSDHCAYPLSAKQAHPEDHRLTPPGAAGIQHRTPVLWNEAVNRRGLSPSEFVDISSTRAAKVLGMYPRKGSITVGADADLVVLDAYANWNGESLPLASPNTFSLYDNYSGSGLPRYVISRGNLVVNDFKYCGDPKHGRFVKRAKRNS